MITKDFIEKIANGTFSKNDVLIQSEVFPDKKDLLWDLWMADKACLDSTGKPQIEDEAQITRINKAISIIEQEYQVKLFDNDEHHTIPVSINIPGEIDTDIFRAFVNISLRNGIIENNNGTIHFTKSNALLAFACGVIFCGDYVGTDKVTKRPVIKRGHDGLFPQSILGTFFGIKRLSQSRSQILDKEPPTGYAEINSLLSKSFDMIRAIS